MTHKTQPTAHAEITAPISADLRRIDDAGAQPAPAIQLEALRIAMHLRQRAQLSRPGNLDTLSASGANELERQHAELSAARAEAKHWRTNHDNVVARLRIFTQRPDIPKELADRLPWYRELVRLQEVEAQALPSVVVGPLAERGILDAIRSAYDLGYNDARSARAVPGDSAPGYKGRQVEGDHGGALVHLLKKLQAAPPAPAAVAVPSLANRVRPGVEAAPWVCDAIMKMETELARLRAALAVAPAQAVPHCGTCNDHGAVGNILTAEPCPDCTPQEHATQLAGQAPAAPVAHPHHCTARSADGACEECEGHAQAMAEWRAEAAAPAQAQEDARDAGRWRHFSARGVFPKNVWNNGNGHWQYGEIRALTAEGVADAAIASSAEQGGA